MSEKQQDDGSIRISPTAIGMWRLCPRKWAFRYIDKIKQPQSPKMLFGIEVHKQIENWLLYKTLPDTSPAGMVARQGIKPGFLPTPDPSLTVEGWIEIPIPEVDPRAVLIGYRDLCIPGDLARPHPLVIDHKTTTSTRWMKTWEQLAKDEQALIYAMHAMKEAGTDEVMLRWIYYIASNPKTGPRKPKGIRKTEYVFERKSEAFQKEWDKVLADCANIVMAKDTFVGANKSAPYDLDGCSAFGGCLFREHCDLPVGSRVAALIAKSDRQHQKQPTEEPTMSLFDSLKKSIKKTTEPEKPPAEPTAEAKDAAEANDALLADLKKDGDATGVNPPARTEAEEAAAAAVPNTAPGETDPRNSPPDVEACPYCKKQYKQLSRHKCPEKPPVVPKSEQQPPAAGVMIVCFDCMLRKGPQRAGAVRELTDWIKPLEQYVAKENEVEHWSLMPYAAGGAMLAAKFDRYLQTHPVNGYLHVDSYSAVGKALKDVLIQHATIVLQGTR